MSEPTISRACVARALRLLGRFVLTPFEQTSWAGCWAALTAGGLVVDDNDPAVGVTTEDADCLAAEHEALFFGTRFPCLELWESCYMTDEGDEPRLLGHRTERVLGAYHRRGLVPDPAFGQPGDHWGIEALFAAHLLEHGGAHGFVAGHLRPFTRRFTSALTDHTVLPRYRALATAMALAVDAAASLRDSPGDDRAGRSEVADGFVAAEGGWEAPVRITMACGLNNGGFRNPIRVLTRHGCVLGVEPGDQADDPTALPNIAIDFDYHNTFLSGQRLRYPLRRVGARGEGRFERISWDEAVSLIASGTRRIREEYGPAARYVNYATGQSAVARGSLMAQGLLALDGGHLGSYNSYSAACTAFATKYTYGTGLSGNTPDDYPNSKLIILWGHNPVETGYGTGTSQWLRRAHDAGTIIVAVDPRTSDSARELADHWIPLRPTTDSALADAMAHTIVSEGLHDQAFMDTYCMGFDAAHMPAGYEGEEDYLSYLYGRRDGIAKTPAWAEPITGVPAATIEWLARLYATSKPAALLQGLGPQRHGNGEQTVRSSFVLPCLTGNIGIPGGSAAGVGGTRTHATPPPIGAQQNPYPGKIPVFLWTRAITDGSAMTSTHDGVQGVDRLETPIKLIVNLAGNTLINQHADINETARILRDDSACELIVTSDLFMTPSALFSDIVLPGASIFESDNIGTPWRPGDYLIASTKCVEPVFESRFEYDWLAEVARELGVHDEFTDGGKTLPERLRDSYEKARLSEPDLPDYASFRTMGLFKHASTRSYVAFREQIEDFEHHRFPTPSGKIEIFSPALHALGNPREIPAIPKYVPSFEGPQDEAVQRFPYQLIGWHTKRRTHSTLDTSPRLERLEPHRLWMHPADAAVIGVHDEEEAEVFNDRGTIRVRVMVTTRIMRGVVGLAQGAWYRPDARGVDTRGNINTLATQRPTPLAKGNPQHSNLVAIRRA